MAKCTLPSIGQLLYVQTPKKTSSRNALRHRKPNSTLTPCGYRVHSVTLARTPLYCPWTNRLELARIRCRSTRCRSKVLQRNVELVLPGKHAYAAEPDTTAAVGGKASTDGDVLRPGRPTAIAESMDVRRPSRICSMLPWKRASKRFHRYDGRLASAWEMDASWSLGTLTHTRTCQNTGDLCRDRRMSEISASLRDI